MTRDFPKLRDVLEELRTEDVSFDAIGFSDGEMRRFLGINETAEDEIPEPEPVSQTAEGDLWILGNHRLLCGDSRDQEALERLTEGQEVNHVYGGPPYFNQREYAQWSSYDNYLQDMQKIIENCCSIMKDGSVLVWNVANDCSAHKDIASHHSVILEKSGLHYLDTIAWLKTKPNYAIPRNFHIKTNHCYYPAFQWEPLLIFQKPGKMPRMTREGRDYMTHYHTNVWEVDAITNQVKLYGHPAVCPVEIPYRSLEAYTGDGARVFEPFAGSGTTLIAAEKAGRKAFLMEWSPTYCDIIVKRWEQMTGQKGKRISQVA